MFTICHQLRRRMGGWFWGKGDPEEVLENRGRCSECASLPLCRFWMVVKEDGHMITARQEPRLVLVSITLENNYLTLEAPGMEPMVLPLKLPSSNKIHDCRCSVWGRWGTATDLIFLHICYSSCQNPS